MLQRFIGWLSVFLLAACTAQAPQAPAPLPEASPSSVGLVAPPTLRIYSWETYIDPALLDRFSAETGAEIVYDTYVSNEELYETLVQGTAMYDLIVPSDYMVSILRREGYLAKLNHENLPNLVNLDPGFTNPNFDPNLRHCVPYLWGTQGLGYRDTGAGPIDSWTIFFDQAVPGRAAFLTDSRSTLGIALIYLGYSPNTLRASEIAAARDFLIARADRFAFVDDEGQDLLLAGEIDMTIDWSGDMLQVIEQDPTLKYSIPNEGSIIWVDTMCVTATTAQQALAEQFINFMLDAEVGAILADYTRYSTPNQAALPLIDPADRANPLLYPDQELRNRLFTLVDLGSDASRLYDEAWAAVLAAR